MRYEVVACHLLQTPIKLRYGPRFANNTLKDPGEFSDASDDSGFEESLDPHRKKEQHLDNDKYDLALEVSMNGPECGLYSSEKLISYNISKIVVIIIIIIKAVQ